MSTPAPSAAQVAESIVADGASASTGGTTPTPDVATGAPSGAKDPPPAAAEGTEAKKPEGEPKPKVAPALEALAKRERETVRREADVKAREEKLTEKLTAAAPVLEALEKGDLHGVLRALKSTNKLTMEALVEAIASFEDEPEDAEPTAAELARKAAAEELDAREEARQKAEQEAFDAEYAKKVQTYTASIATKAKSDPERWELINQGDVDEIAAEAWKAVETAYLEDKMQVSFEEALDIAEAQLLEDEKARLERAKGSKKLGALLGQKASNEDAKKRDGRAATPKQTASGTTGSDDDEDMGSPSADESGGPSMSRIERAMRRAGINA